MIPIRDHNPSGRTPYVAWGLIAINVIVFLSYFWRDLSFLNNFFLTYGLIPGEVTRVLEELLAGGSIGEALTRNVALYDGLLTSMFVHGGIMHLVGNMLFLYIFGDNLEEFFGHVGFLLFYLIGGLAASALHIAIGPDSTVPTVGASGAIAAVMGGYLLLFPKARVDVLVFLIVLVRIVPLPAWIMLLAWLGLQIGGGIVDLGAQGGGVAYWAHAGGFVAGVILVGLALLFGMRVARVAGRPDHDPYEYKRVRTVKGPWG